MASWLSLETALEQALAAVTPLTQSTDVSLYEASGRILAEPVLAPVNVPPWDNSAMDGYAIWVDEKNTSRLSRQLIGTIAAGDVATVEVTPETCVRILTGAPIPKGANAVVIQENTEQKGDLIHINNMPNAKANIRLCANDVSKGDTVLEAGHELTAADLVLLSSLGMNQVKVFSKPKVAIVATGNELVEAGQPCEQQQIFESHRAGLLSKLNALGCEVTDGGIVKDDPELIKETFAALARDHNLVVSSGGVSVGDADWVKPALNSLGTLHLWKVAIKPGKPFAFGQFGNCYFCGLPGNPVSAYVTFEQLATPIIHKLRGGNLKSRLLLNATLSHDHRRRAGRLDFARGQFSQREDGQLTVTILQNQSSGVMTSVTKANCYVLLPADASEFVSGDTVRIQPFSLTC